jgi:hypothetical protein
VLAGFIASRTFEVALHVDPGFSPGVADYFRVGIQALIPFALYGLAGAAVIVLLGGLRQISGSFADRVWHSIVRRIESVPAATLATLIAVAAGLSWLGITMINWSLFEVIFALQGDSPPDAPELATWGPEFYRAYIRHSNWSALLTVALAFAALRWLPHLEKQGDDPQTVRRMKWTTITIAAVVVVSAVTPRRMALDHFPEATVQGRPALVLGTNGGEVLLYATDKQQPVRQRMRLDTPGLSILTTTRRLTSP